MSRPLDVLSATPTALARLVRGRTADHLRTRPFADKWTPNEILGHLTDAEWAFGWRTRIVLGGDGSEIIGFAQDEWVTSQRLNDRDPAELIEMFGQLRRWNLAVWSALTPQDLQRAGRSRTRGQVTLGRLLETFADHDRHHLEQLTRYLAALA